MTSPDIAAASRPLPGWRVEFGRNWPIVLGCLLGLAAGVLSLPFIMVTFFIKDWESEFGWARGSIALAPVCLFSALAIAAPFAGWLSDRIAAVWLVGVSLVGVALGMYLNSTLTGRLWELLALMTFLGLIGAGSSSLVFSRIINANFSDARGTALGIALIVGGSASLQSSDRPTCARAVPRAAATWRITAGARALSRCRWLVLLARQSLFPYYAMHSGAYSRQRRPCLPMV